MFCNFGIIRKNIYFIYQPGRAEGGRQGKATAKFICSSCFVKCKSIDVRLLHRGKGVQAEADISADLISCLLGLKKVRAHAVRCNWRRWKAKQVSSVYFISSHWKLWGT